jgi:bifunctional oligoribonuclease and PAP phosphatase NrnA
LDAGLQVGQILEKAKRVLIVSHIRPDGDAVCSTLGLGLALQNAHKEVQMVMKDGVMKVFKHLPGNDQITKKLEGEFDCRIVVDCSDMLRVGGFLGEFQPDVNIDHHITNLNFAKANLVQPGSVATSAVLAEWLPKWNFPITQPVAELLLSGIIYDSIGFRTSNMNSETLRLAANLMDMGANLPDLYSKALMRPQFEAMRYWGYGLVNLQREDRLIWTQLRMQDRAEAKYPGLDDAELNNLLSNIDDVDISVLFIEQKKDAVKISWRAKNGIDVSAMALAFGGGGHPAAAGADMKGTLDEVRAKVLEATQKLIDEHYLTLKLKIGN